MNENGKYPKKDSMPENHCPRCGENLPADARFCGRCGLDIPHAIIPVIPDVLRIPDYLLMMVGFSIPVVGLILMLYWSFGSSVGPNRKNFARAYLVIYIISLVLSLVFAGFMDHVISTTLQDSGNALSLF